jgi:hypothetical protein
VNDDNTIKQVNPKFDDELDPDEEPEYPNPKD